MSVKILDSLPKISGKTITSNYRMTDVFEERKSELQDDISSIDRYQANETITLSR